MILQKQVAGLTEQSLARFVVRARKAVRLRGSVNVLVTGSTAMKALNARFRGKNKATDVLSFPSDSSLNGRMRRFAGEIAISADIARANAIRLGHTPAQEIKVLALHGLLHLAGLNHERDNGEMARKEAQLRRAFKLPVTLTERGQSRSSPSLRRSARKRSRTP